MAATGKPVNDRCDGIVMGGRGVDGDPLILCQDCQIESIDDESVNGILIEAPDFNDVRPGMRWPACVHQIFEAVTCPLVFCSG